MNTVRRSITITFLAGNAATVVNFLSGLVLARLLEPSDIGLFSMTAVFVGIMHTFRDFGVVSYLLREKDLTREKIRAASGMLIATSWLIAVALLLLAIPVAHFYGQPPVSKIMRVLSLGFFLIPFGSVTQALLRRELAAGKQAWALGISTIAYSGSCILLAALGFGYMSMAWANLFNILVSTLVYACMRPAHQPFLPSFRGWRSIARFGGGSALSNLVTNIDTALPDTLIGKRLDAHGVGIYGRGNSLVDLFTQVVMPPINNAAVPVIAKNFHEQRPLSGDLCKSVSYISGIAWPVLIVTGLFAEDIVRVLYGAKWLDCLPIIFFLCIGSAVRTPFGLTTNALLGIGRPYLSALVVAATLALKLIIVLALGAADLRGFAIAFMLANLLSAPITVAVWQKQFKVTLTELKDAMAPSLLITAIFTCIALATTFLPHSWPSIIRLACVGIVSVVSWLSLIHYCKHPLSYETGILFRKLGKTGLSAE